MGADNAKSQIPEDTMGEPKLAVCDDVEITPEMIEAGEDVLVSTLGGAVSSHWCPPDLASQVYLAMRSMEAESQLANPRRSHEE